MTITGKVSFSGSKKGNFIIDVLIVIVILFAFGFTTYISMFVSDTVNTELQANADLSNTSKEIINTANTKLGSTMDAVFMVAFSLFSILLIVSAFMIIVHPIFFIISLVMIALLSIVSAILSNTFQDFISISQFSSYSSQLPITTFILSNIVIYVVALSFIIATIQYMGSKQ